MLKQEFGEALQIRRYCDEGELDELMCAAESVAARTYQRVLGTGFMDNPESRQILMLAAQKKLLLAYVLSVHEQPSAFIIGRTYHNTFYVQYMGYDTRLSRFSVGTFLLMHCIEGAMSKAVSGDDFGVGNQRYKRSVSNRVEQKARLHLFGPSLKGLALNCACSVLTLCFWPPGDSCEPLDFTSISRISGMTFA